jgi:hypothetical protein
MVTSRHQNAGQTRNKNVANKFLKAMVKIKNFGMTIGDKNYILE